MTLQEFSDHLTTLSMATNEAQQHSAITAFLNKANPDDLFWFIRMVKQELRLGAGARCFFNALSPTAYDTFKLVSSIPEALKEIKKQKSCNDEKGPTKPPTKAHKNKCTTFKLNVPISPQLALATKSIEDVVSRCPNTFYCEVKYDGERIQIHKNEDNTFTYWSRSLRPVKEDKYEGLEKHLRTALSNVRTCILDGEILLVDRKTSCPLPFGTLGKHKKAGFQDANTAIFLFDILMVNDEGCFSKPMSERRRLLNEFVSPIHNRIMLSEMTHIKGSMQQQDAQLRARLQNSIARGLEGLVIKDVNSLYEPDARHWLKLKRDYLAGMADTADLCVLGAKWGSGSQSGIFSTFLMGCYDTSDCKWKTVCHCGNGHDDDTLKKIFKELKPVMIPFNKKVDDVPSWIACDKNVAQDFFIKNPRDAPIWEIKAAEFTKSPKHTANGISLRHPRVVRIRDDKDYLSATSVQQLQQLVNASKARAMQGFVYKPPPPIEEEEELEEQPPADRIPVPVPVPVPKVVGGGGPVDLPKPKLSNDQIMYFCGDFTNPVTLVSLGEPCFRIISHIVAAGGTWSTKGTMGNVTRKFGEEPQEQYDEASVTLTPGDLQLVDVGDPYRSGADLYVGTLISQEKPTSGYPAFSRSGFRAAFKKLVNFAAIKSASIHLSKLYDPREKWSSIHQDICDAVNNTPVRVVIYCKTPEDVLRLVKLPQPASSSTPKKKRPAEDPITSQDTIVCTPVGNISSEIKRIKPEEVGQEPDESILMGLSTAKMMGSPGGEKIMAINNKVAGNPSVLSMSTDPMSYSGRNSGGSDNSPIQAITAAELGKGSQLAQELAMSMNTDPMSMSSKKSRGTDSSTNSIKRLKQEDTLLVPDGKSPPVVCSRITTPPLRQISSGGNTCSDESEILAGCTIVVSGFSATEKKAIKNKCVQLGASLSPHWSPGTIMICETMTTEFERAYNHNGNIVNRRYIEDCLTSMKKLSFSKYAYPATSTDSEASLPAVKAPPTTSSIQPMPPPVFRDCIIVIHREGSTPEEVKISQELERYIFAYDGDVTTEVDPLPSHFVVVSSGPKLAAIATASPAVSKILVTPDWVWSSVNASCKLDVSQFRPTV
eukprot:TRINITY_DN960_c0_g2_i1.p1 TRINITY_DN960_c0_g2~~TRINITY_DN960_c0_g2_i1.p1  ORF type:complete len:1237 (+),score=263.16 TRINITY_DN960_c0_g2_i1:395-3712(+)